MMFQSEGPFSPGNWKDRIAIFVNGNDCRRNKFKGEDKEFECQDILLDT